MAVLIGQDLIGNLLAAKVEVRRIDLGVLAQVQAGQPIAAAPEPLQRRVLAHVQGAQLIVLAGKAFEDGILADVQGGELVIAAVEPY